jgi:hypothetical protein
VTVDPVSLPSRARGILVGASGTGKSTLAKHVLTQFRVENPDARILVLDTKPRWRGEVQADGTSTRRLYRKFVKGDTIPGARILSRRDDWSIVWNRDTTPTQTVIVQKPTATQRANVRFQVWASERFFQSQDARRPSLIYWDEGMDFFETNSSALGSDIVQRCYRAGRELNLTSLIGVQRPKGINLQCLTETSWCALFRINFTQDVKRLHEMGWPPTVGPPDFTTPYAFRLWRDDRPGAPLYRILPKG